MVCVGNNEEKVKLTCPKCKKDGQENFSVLFPHNLTIYKFIGKKEEVSFKALIDKARTFIKHTYFVPVLFRCKQCDQYFKLNKNGKEFVPRFSRLCCPECNFNEFGKMIVRSRDLDRHSAARSKDWRRSHFYDDMLSANGFKCPRCFAEFGG